MPLVFLASSLALASTGVVAPAAGPNPVDGMMLVVVGVTLLASLWLAGWWHGGPPAEE